MNSYCPECNKPLRNPSRCSCGWELRKIDRQEDFMCAASGCPLLGTISSGSDKFYCYIHSGSSNSVGVTSNIMDRRGFIELARRGLSISPFGWDHGKEKADVIAYLQSRGRDDLLPTEKDSAHGWASRCLNILKAECLSVKSNWRGINPATEKIKSFVFDRYGKKQDDFYEPGVE